MSSTWNFGEFYARKAAWSLETFGPAQTTAGVVAHMRKELDELRVSIANPGRKCGEIDAIREELSNICLLAIELSWRGGGDASDFGEIVGERDSMSIASAATYAGLHLDAICRGVMGARAVAVVIWDIAFRALGCDPTPILEKFEALQTRTWPDWRTIAPDQPIEHVRTPSLDETMQRCAGVLSALAPHDGGDSLETRITKLTAERDAARQLADRREQDHDDLETESEHLREAIRLTGWGEVEDAKTAVLRVVDERDRLLSERTEWCADNQRMGIERDDARKLREVQNIENEMFRRECDDARRVLAAFSHETVTMAAQRMAAERDALRDSKPSPTDWKPLCQALGMEAHLLPFSAVIERAGQLRDDSVSYHALRGQLATLLGIGLKFDDDAIADTIIDRIENPVNDAALDVEEVVTGLEEDIATLKAALHVATRGRS